MTPVWLLTIYCALVLVGSLAGGWVRLIIDPTHTRLPMAVSFVAGLMLGIVLLHFLPDATNNYTRWIEQRHGCPAGCWRCFSPTLL